VLRLSDAAGILTAVPYLIGFEPHDSLVVLALHGPRRRVGLTLRVDLDGGPPSALAAEVARHVATDLSGSAVRAAIAVIYKGRGSDDQADAAAGSSRSQLVTRLRSRLSAEGVRVLNVLHVQGGRWWSDAPCQDPACCPPDGGLLPKAGRPGAPPSSSLAAATLVADGRAVLPDRAALEQLLDADPAADHVGVRQAMLECEGVDRTSTLRRLRPAARAAAAGRRLSDVAVARLGAGLRAVPMRDEVLSLVIEPGAADLRELFIQLVQRLPPLDDAQVAAMLAWIAHAEGSGALANVAVERALAALPEHSLARLVDSALRQGLPPERLHEVARALRAGSAAS